MVIPRRAGTIAFVSALFLAALQPSGADQVETFLEEVDQAVLDESYTRAIALLEEGRSLYPSDYRFPARAGRLYQDRELYRLALAEYRTALELNPAALGLLGDIAAVQGYLGDNGGAVDTLEQLLAGLSANDTEGDGDLSDEAIDDLSWMYFKTHRMDDGIALLEDALGRRFDRSWAHTLGTLYSGIYDFEESRKWYMRSIEDALDEGDEYFASVAHYNLALLEISFYHYQEARKEAQRSLELRSRAGGHMVIGELDFLAWKLDAALDAYRTAESLDETPLAQLDIAAYYRRIGRLNEAIRFVSDDEVGDDAGWMYHYGLDRRRFDMDVSGIRAEAYRGLLEVDRLTPRFGFRSLPSTMVRRWSWRIHAAYNDRWNRALTAQHADALRQEGNALDAAWNEALALGGYRRSALAAWAEARELETAFAPGSDPWYLLEMGIEQGDALMLQRALEGFSPLEVDPVERTLRELSLNSGRRRGAGSGRLARLYGMNPGGLRQYGLSLPIAVIVSGDMPTATGRRVRTVLRRAGYRIADPREPGPDDAVLTAVADGTDGIRWYLAAPDGRTRAEAHSSVLVRRRRLAPLLAGLLDGFYATPIRETTP